MAEWARTYAVATILGMERLTEAGRQIAAFVIDARGQIQGCQTKNQLDPTEDREGVRLTEWGSSGGPYYEKAMMMRSIENTIWFASVNYALRHPEAATSIIDPAGRCHAFLPYGEEGVLVSEIDVEKATGVLARRYSPERYQEDPDGSPSPLTG